MAQANESASRLQSAVIIGLSVVCVNTVGTVLVEAVLHHLEQRENALLRAACVESGGTVIVGKDERVHCFGCTTPKPLAWLP